jgi:hypothetical protein
MTASTGRRFGAGARVPGKHATSDPVGSLVAMATAWLTFAASAMSLTATLLALHVF